MGCSASPQRYNLPVTRSTSRGKSFGRTLIGFQRGQAFRRFLKKGAQGWVPRLYPATMEMIRLIHAERGWPSWLSPGLGIPNEVLLDLASQGLMGLKPFTLRTNRVWSKNTFIWLISLD